MSRLLNWREAEHADREALQRFVCTVPHERRFQQKRPCHPRPWELTVQSGIRALRPPMPDGQLLLLGLRDQEIAAVSLLADQADTSVVKIQAIAVASRYRSRGGLHSAEAMELTLEAAAEGARKRGHSTVVVVGWVDPRNTPSKRMNERAGLTLRRITPGQLEEWIVAIDLAD